MLKKSNVIRLLTLAMILAGSVSLSRAETVLEDDWYSLMLGDSPLGHLHSLVVKGESAGSAAIKSTTETVMVMPRMGMDITITSKTLFVDDLNFNPRSFRSEMSLSQMATVTEGTVKGREIAIIQSVGGRREEKKITLDADTIFPSGKFKDLFLGEIKRGETVRCKIFIPDLLMVANHTIVPAGHETITVMNRAVEAFKTVSTNDLIPTMPTTEWVDDKGTILQFEMPMMGTVVRGRMVTKDEALNPGTTTSPAIDIFKDFLIKPEPPLVDPGKLGSIRYELSVSKEGAVPEIPADERQTIISRTGGSLILNVRRIALPKESDSRTLPLIEPAVREFQRSTTFIQSNDVAIMALSAKIVGTEKNVVKAATAVTHWVYRNIKKKNLSIGFASAAEVSRNLEGDCTEHSVLAAAICRAAGIPARLCLGIVYSSQLKAFGYHMWFEIWSGSWFQMDPTFDQVEPDPSHIVFARGNMDNEDLVKATAVLNDAIARLGIKVLATE